MKKSLIVAAVIIAALASVVAAQKASTGKHAKEVIYETPNNAKFDSPTPGVSMATLWGDPAKSVHGTFTKFDPGYDAGMHSHSNDLWIIGIKGAYVYKDDAGEKRVGPGEFLRIPGGHKHWSGGDKTEGALFYEEGAGKFDSTPVK
jgi:quercetin dioxygenase-like cupin family protein